jgi:hypothetical protein
MSGNDRLALGVLRHLAATRGPDDALGSLARGVLSGQSSLREAVTWSWHGEAMAEAFAAAQRDRDRMSAAERAGYDEQAASLARRLTPGRLGGSRSLEADSPVCLDDDSDRAAGT